MVQTMFGAVKHRKSLDPITNVWFLKNVLPAGRAIVLLSIAYNVSSRGSVQPV